MTKWNLTWIVFWIVVGVVAITQLYHKNQCRMAAIAANMAVEDIEKTCK